MGIFEHSTQPNKSINHQSQCTIFYRLLGQPLSQPFITQGGSVHTSDKNLTQALNSIKLCINTLKTTIVQIQQRPVISQRCLHYRALY